MAKKARKVTIRIATNDEVLRFGQAHYDSDATKKDIKRFLKEQKIPVGRLNDLLLNTRTSPESGDAHDYEFKTSAYVPVRNERKRKTRDWKARSTGWENNYCEWFSKLVRVVRYYLKSSSSPTVLTYEEGSVTMERVLGGAAKQINLEYVIEKV